MKNRKRRHGLCYLVDESESTSTGGGETTPSPAPTEASTDANQPGEMPGESQTDDQPVITRPSLSELVAKQFASDKSADDVATPATEKPVEKPVTPAIEEKLVEAKPVEGEKPADEAKPDDKAKEGEAKPEELKLLSKEEIEKEHPKAPKPLREYADRVSRKLEEVEKTVDDFGGFKALKTLESVATTLTQTTPEAALEFQTTLKERNPKFLSELQTNIFNGALDEHPELLESVIKTVLGQEWTGEKLKMIAQAVRDGDLDLEEVATQQEARLATKDPEAHKQLKELRDEVAALKGDGTEVKETKAQAETRMRIQTDVADLRVRYHDQTVNPVLQLHGFMPGKDDPKEVVADKAELVEFIREKIQAAVNKNQSWKNLDGMIFSGLKGDVYEWELDRAMKAAKGIAIETALRWQRWLNPYLASMNSSIATRNKERIPSEKDTTIDEPSPVEAPSGVRIGDMTDEQKKAHFASIVQRNKGNSASV